MVKALYFDGSGLCVFHKRLDKGRFALPEPTTVGGEAVVELNERELDELLDGLVGAKEKTKKTFH